MTIDTIVTPAPPAPAPNVTLKAPLANAFSLLSVVLFSAGGAVAQEPAVRFDGEFAKPASFDRAALAKLPRTKVEASDHGKPGTWEGVAFDELPEAGAGAPLGDGLRGGKLASYLVVWRGRRLSRRVLAGRVRRGVRRDARAISRLDSTRACAPLEARAVKVRARPFGDRTTDSAPLRRWVRRC